MRYRQKPVVIDAFQFDGTNHFALMEWRAQFGGSSQWKFHDGGLTIPTLEGEHFASPGDWIIRGVKGEYYPCKPDIFALTYEPEAAAAPSSTEPRK